MVVRFVRNNSEIRLPIRVPINKGVNDKIYGTPELVLFSSNPSKEDWYTGKKDSQPKIYDRSLT